MSGGSHRIRLVEVRLRNSWRASTSWSAKLKPWSRVWRLISRTRQKRQRMRGNEDRNRASEVVDLFASDLVRRSDADGSIDKRRRFPVSNRCWVSPPFLN